MGHISEAWTNLTSPGAIFLTDGAMESARIKRQPTPVAAAGAFF